MELQKLRVDVGDGVAQVILANPDRRNAMDGAFFNEIRSAFESLGRDPAVRAVVLAAEGPHFSAGLDLDWAGAKFGGEGGDPGRRREHLLRTIRDMQAAFDAIESCRAPVIAAIQGKCIGGGVDLIAACDLRVASADAAFLIAEIDLAITADLGTLQRLPHLMPAGIVRELALTGRPMPAAEAGRWGLVNRIEDDAEAARASARELAQRIAAKSPLAVSGTKYVLNRSRGRPIEDGLALAGLWNSAMMLGADGVETMAARAARREPAFPPLLKD